MAYINLSCVYAKMGDTLKGLKYCTKALDIARSIKDANTEASALNGIGEIYLIKGETKQAHEHFLRAANLSKELGDDEGYQYNMNRIHSLSPESNP